MAAAHGSSGGHDDDKRPLSKEPRHREEPDTRGKGRAPAHLLLTGPPAPREKPSRLHTAHARGEPCAVPRPPVRRECKHTRYGTCGLIAESVKQEDLHLLRGTWGEPLERQNGGRPPAPTAARCSG